MNFTIPTGFDIKANWFDHQTETNIFKQIGVEGYYIYMSLFKFRLYNQDVDYKFITSIKLLRKETGYTTNIIYNNLVLLEKLKIISIVSHSKWKQQILDKNKKINDKETLIIDAIDQPDRKITQLDSTNQSEKYDNYYITLMPEIIEEYKRRGLNEKYLPIYTLLLKLSNNYMNGKVATMKIENIADTLGMHHDTLHKMIIEMNRKRVLVSEKKSNGKGGYKFEIIQIFI